MTLVIEKSKLPLFGWMFPPKIRGHSHVSWLTRKHKPKFPSEVSPGPKHHTSAAKEFVN